MVGLREGNGAAVGPVDGADEPFARAGDAYLARGFGLAWYLTGNAADAEEATQEAMARAWSARRSLRNPEAFGAWFDRILVNTCRERARRRGPVREVELPAGEQGPPARDELDAVLAREAIGRALAVLPLEQRAAVVLRYWRDLSLEQIAERLDWPLGTVKSRLHNALAAMRSALERDEGEVLR